MFYKLYFWSKSYWAGWARVLARSQLPLCLFLFSGLIRLSETRNKWWRALDNASVFLLCLSVCSWVFLFSLVFLRVLLFSGKSLLPEKTRRLCLCNGMHRGKLASVFFPGEMKKMNSVYWNDAVFAMGTDVFYLVLYVLTFCNEDPGYNLIGPLHVCSLYEPVLGFWIFQFSP